MTYDANTPIRLAPGEAQDMSADQWVAVLRAAGSFNSPLWNGLGDKEGVARDMWQLVTTRRHRASFWLAIPGREHQWGTDDDSVLRRNDTRSWTNARTCRTPGMHYTIVRDAVRKSEYVRYVSVVDSLIDGLNRVDDPGYAYAGKASVSDVIHVWTESEGDDYTAYVVDKMNEWSTPMAGDDPRFQWTPDTDEYGYPQRTHGRNGQPIELIILHITAGTDSQAWLLGGHGSSTHYLTNKDGTPRAQHVADADAAWTPGSRDYALRSINVEVEMLNTSDWTDAIMREVARTIAPIMQRHNIPADYLWRDNGPGKRGMIGHRDVPDPTKPGQWGGSSNHDDPGKGFRWDLFTPMVAAEMAGGVIIPPNPSAPIAVPPAIPDPWKSPIRPNTWIPRVFVDEINREDFMRAGYVVSEGFAEDDKFVQYFQRARLELNRDGSVTWGLVGEEALAARYPNRRAA